LTAASVAKAEVTAVQHDRRGAHFVQQTPSRLFDRITMSIERSDQVVFTSRRCAKVIFERLCGNRALNPHAVDLCWKGDDQIASAIFRTLLGKMNFHDRSLKMGVALEAPSWERLQRPRGKAKRLPPRMAPVCEQDSRRLRIAIFSPTIRFDLGQVAS
jgi:hypothetical protein